MCVRECLSTRLCVCLYFDVCLCVSMCVCVSDGGVSPRWHLSAYSSRHCLNKQNKKENGGDGRENGVNV